MRLLRITLSLLLFVVSCKTEERSENWHPQKYYVERHLSFFDPYEPNYLNGKYQGYIYEKWLRRPENLKMVHETFKKIGYLNLVSDYDLKSAPCLIWGYVNRPLDQLIDSLIITFPKDSIKTKYYREFWQRRKNEDNADIVYEILLELDSILVKKEQVQINNSLVNDTLYNLISIERLQDSLTKEEALKDFEYLKLIGLHGSAYNLLYENYRYQSVIWNKDSLVRQLETDTINCCPITWIKDDTK